MSYNFLIFTTFPIQWGGRKSLYSVLFFLSLPLIRGRAKIIALPFKSGISFWRSKFTESPFFCIKNGSNRTIYFKNYILKKPSYPSFNTKFNFSMRFFFVNQVDEFYQILIHFLDNLLLRENRDLYFPHRLIYINSYSHTNFYLQQELTPI